MATSSCSIVTFFRTCDNALYFEVAETDVDGDNFQMTNTEKHSYFKSKDNKYLILNAENQLQVQNLTIYQQRQSECKLKIQIFRGSIRESGEGKPVMLYIEKDGKKMVVCCSDGHNICSEEMVLPQEIEATAHKAVFYMVELSASNQYMFESTLYQSQFLGFQPDADNPSLKKLVLQHKRKEEVVDSCTVILSDYKQD